MKLLRIPLLLLFIIASISSTLALTPTSSSSSSSSEVSKGKRLLRGQWDKLVERWKAYNNVETNEGNEAKSIKKKMKKKKVKGAKKKGEKNSKKSNKGKKGKKGKLNACISAFATATNSTDTDINGRISIGFSAMDMALKYDLKNLPVHLTESNPGYIELDISESCNETMGAYWNDEGNVTANPNPWTNEVTAFFAKDDDMDEAKGLIEVNNGYYWGDNQGRAVVVMDNSRTVIGCGILSTEKCKREKKRQSFYEDTTRKLIETALEFISRPDDEVLDWQK